MWLLIIGTAFVCLLITDYLYKRRSKNILKMSGIRGPSYTLPIFGDIAVTLKNDPSNIFEFFKSLRSQYGKLYRLWAFHHLTMVIEDPRYFETILSSATLTRKPFVYDMFSQWLGDGLLLSYGSKWHARRKILTPSYHFKILEEFVEVFDKESDVLVRKLASKADGKTPFDVFPIICLTALDIISETAMGVQINAQEYPNFPYALAVRDATGILGARIVNLSKVYDITFLLTTLPSYLKLRKCIKTMHDFTNKVIKDRRAKMNANNSVKHEEKQNVSDVGQKKRMAFLDVLLQSTINGKPLSQDDIREEVDTFMFEGHDTTTSGISFCLYLLARHAEVQQRVFNEVIEILGEDKEKPVTMRDLQDLKYLEAVIKESLRMYPSVPMIGRQITEDTKIGNQTIPANTKVALLVYGAGRDPDYFENPNDFNPERFYSDSPDKINPFAYVPFSAGPRNCIGQKFAMLEMKSTISKVLRYYELLPLGEEPVLALTLILRSKNGINIGLKPRKYYV